MKHLLLLCLIVCCCLSCNKEKRMMRDFDEITERDETGKIIGNTDKCDWTCDGEMPDKVVAYFDELDKSGYWNYDTYNEGIMTTDDIKQIYAYSNPTPTGLYNLVIEHTPQSSGIMEMAIVDEDLNLWGYDGINIKTKTIFDATLPNGNIVVVYDTGADMRNYRVYYRIFTKQNGDVCIGLRT